MATAARRWLSGRVIYPLLAVALLGAVFGLQYCPMTWRPAPDFTLPVVTADGMHGDRLRLGDLHGKVVLVDFWATWCRPCQMSTPALVHIADRYRARGLMVLGVNVDENSADAVPPFIRHFGIGYTVLYDDAGAAQTAYGIRALPTAVLIDRLGRIRRVHQGVAEESDLASQVEGLL